MMKSFLKVLKTQKLVLYYERKPHQRSFSYVPLLSFWDLLHFFLLQSALTGESLPVTKNPGDGVYSGSTCKQGEIEAVVIATGVHTFFGKAAHLVESTTHVGHFQKVHHITSLHFNK